jgi:hypothetical protein
MKDKAFIVDIDGTLSILNGREPHDEAFETDSLNETLKQMLQILTLELDAKVILVTGRFEKSREETEKWLEKNGIIYDELFMRPDESGKMGNVQIKQWYLENVIKRDYDPILAFEDMWRAAEMYRSHGVPCWQVNRDPFFKDTNE